eukprot:Gb_30094 [translate_table: standard]
MSRYSTWILRPATLCCVLIWRLLLVISDMNASESTASLHIRAAVLEVVCGRPPMLDCETHLVDLLWKPCCQGNISSAVDPRSCETFDEEEVELARGLFNDVSQQFVEEEQQ